ncbi:hypothetical protein ACP70R_002848 [Stipagrostis hirtigluma subsp. patula]
MRSGKVIKSVAVEYGSGQVVNSAADGNGRRVADGTERRVDVVVPVGFGVAIAAGFTREQLNEVENSLQIDQANGSMNGSRSKGSTPALARRIVETLTQNRKTKPWSSPLPPKRISPPRTLGYALESAQQSYTKTTSYAGEV